MKNGIVSFCFVCAFICYSYGQTGKVSVYNIKITESYSPAGIVVTAETTTANLGGYTLTYKAVLCCKNHNDSNIYMSQGLGINYDIGYQIMEFDDLRWFFSSNFFLKILMNPGL